MEAALSKVQLLRVKSSITLQAFTNSPSQAAILFLQSIYVITHDSASKILRKSSENHREIMVHVDLCIRSKTNDVIPNNDTFEHEAFVTALMFPRL